MEGLGKGSPRLAGYDFSVWWFSTVLCSPAGKGRGKAGEWWENAHLSAFLSSFLSRCSCPVTAQAHGNRCTSEPLDGAWTPPWALPPGAAPLNKNLKGSLSWPEGGRGRIARAQAHLRLHLARMRVSHVWNQLARPST